MLLILHNTNKEVCFQGKELLRGKEKLKCKSKKQNKADPKQTEKTIGGHLKKRKKRFCGLFNNKILCLFVITD